MNFEEKVAKSASCMTLIKKNAILVNDIGLAKLGGSSKKEI